MADWAPPSDASLSTGSVGLSADLIAIRDLPAALAERAEGAPWLNGVGAEEVFTSSNASWSVPSGVTRIHVECIGAGGAGGAGIDNNAGASALGCGGGGGSGGRTTAVIDVSSAATLNIQIGAGGAGGSGNGGDGGNTTVSGTGFTTVTANGGGGGGSGTNASGSPGAGAAAAGDGTPGVPGESGLRLTSTIGQSGGGAASSYGGGAAPVVTDAVGENASVPGAGGSGGRAVNASGTRTRNGGNGAAGRVVLTY